MLSFSPRGLVLATFAAIRFLVGAIGLLAALAYIGLFVLSLVHAPHIASNRYVERIAHLLAPSIVALSRQFGWRWPGTHPNWAPLILSAAVAIARSLIDGALFRLDGAIRRLWKPAAPKNAAGEARAQSRYTLSAQSETDRTLLLKRYREIEEALKSTARKTCTFVSIDVVGSTEMKRGERETAIAATFQAYEEMVRTIFAQYRVWKDTWTPDGVMACFLDCDLAVSAAQQVLLALPKFNESENQLRTPIRVRCGLNQGEVVVFEDSALEKVADHVIDVAGHMQKHAQPDGLQISDAVYAKLAKPDGFVATDRNVDGYATYEWSSPATGA